MDENERSASTHVEDTWKEDIGWRRHVDIAMTWRATIRGWTRLVDVEVVPHRRAAEVLGVVVRDERARLRAVRPHPEPRDALRGHREAAAAHSHAHAAAVAEAAAAASVALRMPVPSSSSCSSVERSALRRRRRARLPAAVVHVVRVRVVRAVRDRGAGWLRRAVASLLRRRGARVAALMEGTEEEEEEERCKTHAFGVERRRSRRWHLARRDGMPRAEATRDRGSRRRDAARTVGDCAQPLMLASRVSRVARSGRARGSSGGAEGDATAVAAQRSVRGRGRFHAQKKVHRSVERGRDQMLTPSDG